VTTREADGAYPLRMILPLTMLVVPSLLRMAKSMVLPS